jgi:hypothetical protein
MRSHEFLSARAFDWNTQQQLLDTDAGGKVLWKAKLCQVGEEIGGAGGFGHAARRYCPDLIYGLRFFVRYRGLVSRFVFWWNCDQLGATLSCSSHGYFLLERNFVVEIVEVRRRLRLDCGLRGSAPDACGAAGLGAVIKQRGAADTGAKRGFDEVKPNLATGPSIHFVTISKSSGVGAVQDHDLMMQIGRRGDFPLASALVLILMATVTLAYLACSRWLKIESA